MLQKYYFASKGFFLPESFIDYQSTTMDLTGERSNTEFFHMRNSVHTLTPPVHMAIRLTLE
jgi:hypothetical protein